MNQTPNPPPEWLSRLDELLGFTGPLEEFWPIFLREAARLLRCESGTILLRDRAASAAWVRTFLLPKSGSDSDPLLENDEQLAAVANIALARESAEARGKADGSLVAIRLRTEEVARDFVAVFHRSKTVEASADEDRAAIKVLSHAVRVQQMRLAARVDPGVAQVGSALDLAMLLNEQKRSLAATMLFCNEIASQFRATRVSLGWVHGREVRLNATSHTNRFEKKMGIVRELEGAMQEAYDQDEEVLWPPLKNDLAVCRDHEIYARSQSVAQVLSIPIRLDGEIKGILTVERNEPRFRSVEAAGLRLMCDLAARRLDDLALRGRGLFALLAAATRNSLAWFFGPEHTWIKLTAVLVSAALAFVVLHKMPYHVQGEFRLTPQTLVFLPAPFDGFIEKVAVRPGDIVHKDQFLVAFDDNQLKLQEAQQLASQFRYKSEVQLAQAADKIGEMHVAEAQVQQATDMLKQVRYDLSRAEVHSPFDGVVVEGDLSTRIGSPAKKGEVLLKVCHLEELYVHVEIPEADIHMVKTGMTGQIAFASRPELKFPIVVDLIEPAAQAKKEGNVFVARCSFHDALPDWWRPGMTGVAKLDAGESNLFWVLTHRLIDTLRLKFWL